MKLETAGSRSISEVNEQQLRQTFTDDDCRGEFVILSQAPQVYIQASGDADGPYSLEYRDGDGDHHFSAVGKVRKGMYCGHFFGIWLAIPAGERSSRGRK